MSKLTKQYNALDFADNMLTTCERINVALDKYSELDRKRAEKVPQYEYDIVQNEYGIAVTKLMQNLEDNNRYAFGRGYAAGTYDSNMKFIKGTIFGSVMAVACAVAIKKRDVIKKKMKELKNKEVIENTD